MQTLAPSRDIVSDMSNFHAVCRRVLQASRNMQDKPSHLIHYAASYAEYGVSCCVVGEARVQALYIVNNLSTWRGETAKEDRAFLRRFGMDA